MTEVREIPCTWPELNPINGPHYNGLSCDSLNFLYSPTDITGLLNYTSRFGWSEAAKEILQEFIRIQMFVDENEIDDTWKKDYETVFSPDLHFMMDRAGEPVIWDVPYNPDFFASHHTFYVPEDLLRPHLDKDAFSDHPLFSQVDHIKKIKKIKIKPPNREIKMNKVKIIEPHSANPEGEFLEPDNMDREKKPRTIKKFLSSAKHNAIASDVINQVETNDGVVLTVTNRSRQTTKYRKVALEAKFGELPALEYTKQRVKAGARYFYELRKYKEKTSDLWRKKLKITVRVWHIVRLQPFEIKCTQFVVIGGQIDYKHLINKFYARIDGEKYPLDVKVEFSHVVTERVNNIEIGVSMTDIFLTCSHLFSNTLDLENENFNACHHCGAHACYAASCCMGYFCNRCKRTTHAKEMNDRLLYCPRLFAQNSDFDPLYYLLKLRPCMPLLTLKPELFYLPERFILKQNGGIHKELFPPCIGNMDDITQLIENLTNYYHRTAPLFKIPHFGHESAGMFYLEVASIWNANKVLTNLQFQGLLEAFQPQFKMVSSLIASNGLRNTRKWFFMQLAQKEIQQMREVIEQEETTWTVVQEQRPKAKRGKINRKTATPFKLESAPYIKTIELSQPYAPLEIESLPLVKKIDGQMMNAFKDANIAISATSKAVREETIPTLNAAASNFTISVDNLTTKLSETTSKANDLLDRVTAACPNVAPSTEPSMSIAESIATTILEVFRILFPNVQFDLASAGRLTLLVAEIFMDDTPITAKKIIIYAMRIFLEFTNTSCDFIKKVVRRCQSYLFSFKDTVSCKPKQAADTQDLSSASETVIDEIEMQDIRIKDIDSQAGPISICMTVLSTLNGMLFGGRSGLMNSFTTTTRFIAEMAKLPDTVHNFLITYMKYLPNFIKRWVAATSGTYAWNCAFQPNGCYFNFTQYSTAAIEMARAGKTISQYQWKMIDAEAILITNLFLKHPKNPPQQAIQFFNNRKHELDKIRSTIDVREHEPFVVYVHGDAGIGKTTISRVIAAYLLGIETLEEVEEHIYTRNPTLEYWDGYRGQKVVIYDDFGQDIENELDVKELLQVVSNTRFIPPFASMTSDKAAGKGEFFNSPFIICLSNQLYIRPKTIASAEALHRRRHIVVTAKSSGDFEDDFSHLTFKTCSPFPESLNKTFQSWRGVPIGKTLNISEFFQAILTSLYYSYDLRLTSNKACNLLLSKVLNEDNVMIPGQIKHMVDEDRYIRQPLNVTSAFDPAFEKFYDVSDEIITVTKQSDDDDLDAIQQESPISRTADWNSFPKEELEDMLTVCNEMRDRDKLPPKVRDNLEHHLHAIERAYMMKSSFIYRTKQYIRFIFTSNDWLAWMQRVGAVAALIAAAGSIYGVYKLFRTFSPVRPQSSEIFTKHAVRPVVRAPNPSIKVIDPNMSQATYDKLTAMTTITLINNQTRSRVAATAVKGRAIISVKHFFDTMTDGDTFTLLRHARDKVTEFQIVFSSNDCRYCSFDRHDTTLLKLAKVTEYTHRDLCFYRCPIQVPSFPDYSKRFILGSQISNFLNGNVVCLFTGRVQQAPYAIRCEIKKYEGGACATAIEYNCVTMNGDCGAPIFIDTDTLQNNLMGIHFGGSRDGTPTGYAMIITQELVEKALASMEVQVILQDFSPRDVNTEKLIELPGNLTCVGTAMQPTHSKLNTKINPSFLFECEGPRTTEPSILHSRDPRLQGRTFEPMLDGISKFSKVVKPFPEDHIKLAIFSLKRHLLRANAKLSPQRITRILTDFETINGIPEIPHIDSLDMTTSPGYPYNKHYSIKRQLFTEPPYVMTAPMLIERFAERERMARLGIRMSVPWQDCLKDERRVLEKIYEKPSTRCFNIPPVDYTLLGRKYCLAFIGWMYSLHTEIFCKAGMDPYSSEWNKMIKDLMKISDTGFNYDYKKFDGTQFVGYRAFLELAKWFYNNFVDIEEETIDDQVRRVLVDECIHTISMCLYFIYMKHIGTPSGAFLTMIVNCIAAAMNVRLAYIGLNPEGPSLDDYDDNVGEAILGDDGIITTSPSIKSWFNLGAIANYLMQYGIEITTGAKGLIGEDHAELPVPALSFLKRRSVLIGDIYYSQLEERVIVEMIYWYRKEHSTTQLQCVEQIVTVAMREMFAYGRQRYHEFKKTIERVAHDKGYSLCVPPFTQYELEFNGRYMTEYSRLVKVNPDQFLLHLDPDIIPNMNNLNDYELIFNDEEGVVDILIKNINSQMSTIDGDAMQAGAAFQTTSVGATLHEQTQPQEISFDYGRNYQGDARAQSVLNEEKWSLEKQLGRWSFVKQLTWTTTQAPGTIISGLKIIQDLIVSSLQAAPFDHFRYVRWKTVRLKILVNGNKFFPGQLCGFFVPYTSDTVARQWQGSTLRGWTQMQNVMIAANKSGIGILEFDFRYPYNWFDLLGTNPPIGMFYLGVFNQLASTLSTPPVVDIQLWTQIEGAEFKIPIPATPAPSLRDRQRSRKTRHDVDYALVNNEECVIKHINRHMLEEIGQSLGKEGDKILNELIPDNISGGILDILGGMDKPTTSANPIIFRQFPEGFLPHADNLEHYPKLQMYPSKQVLSDKEHFATAGPEMTLYDLMRVRPNLLKTVSWTTTQTPGTVLYRARVGPMSSYVATDTANVPTQPTIVDYVSQPFNKWRGALCYMAQAVATMFNTGRLMWTFYPECPSDEVPDPILSKSSVYVQLIDMKDAIGIGRILCPYLADRPWKKVDSGSRDFGVTDVNFSGVVELSVVTPLVAGSDLPPNIDVNIFQWAGDDYELNVFDYNNASILEYDIPESTIKHIQRQMFEGGINLVQTKEQPSPDVAKVQNNHGTQDLSFAPQVMGTEKSTTTLAQSRAKTFDGGKVPHYGEKFNSMKDLMKRFIIRRTPLSFEDLTENEKNGLDPILTSIDPATLTLAGNGAMSWYGRMWRFNRNGYRFKARFEAYYGDETAITKAPIARVLVTQIPVNANTVDLSQLRSVFPSGTYSFGNVATPPLAAIRGNDTLEFEVPYVREENIMITPCQPELGDLEDPLFSHSLVLFAIYLEPVVIPAGKPLGIMIESFTALSDEGMFGTFVGIPLTYISAFNTVNSYWYFPPPKGTKNVPIKASSNLHFRTYRADRKAAVKNQTHGKD